MDSGDRFYFMIDIFFGVLVLQIFSWQRCFYQFLYNYRMEQIRSASIFLFF